MTSNEATNLGIYPLYHFYFHDAFRHAISIWQVAIGNWVFFAFRSSASRVPQYITHGSFFLPLSFDFPAVNLHPMVKTQKAAEPRRAKEANRTINRQKTLAQVKPDLYVLLYHDRTAGVCCTYLPKRGRRNMKRCTAASRAIDANNLRRRLSSALHLN